MEPAYTTYELGEWFKPKTNELSGKHLELGLPQPMVQHMSAARFHEVAGKGPMPPFVKLAGLLGKHAWHIEAPYRPYKLHIAVWTDDLCARASSYDAALDLLDELKDALEHDTVMRSALIRAVIAGVPGLAGEEPRELDEYARAAGM